MGMMMLMTEAKAWGWVPSGGGGGDNDVDELMNGDADDYDGDDEKEYCCQYWGCIASTTKQWLILNNICDDETAMYKFYYNCANKTMSILWEDIDCERYIENGKTKCEILHQYNDNEMN